MSEATDTILADYYDSDYPGILGGFETNCDEAWCNLGLASDTGFYAGVARAAGRRVLELGAGTGRVTEGLLRAGLLVDAVEPAPAMRARLVRKLGCAISGGALRVAEEIQEVQGVAYDCAVLAFGVLSCLGSTKAQRALLSAIRGRLRPGGTLALDVLDRASLASAPSGAQLPSWVRTHSERGGRYARFAKRSELDRQGRMTISGEYREQGRKAQRFEIEQLLPRREEIAESLVQSGFEDVLLSLGFERERSYGQRLFALAKAGPSSRRSHELLWSPEPPGTAATALASAAARAQDAREENHVGDPYALCLQGDSGRRLLAMLGGAEMRASIVARTAWFDQQIAQFALGARSLLNLGAGLCTRPLRLDACRTLDITEVDHPDTLQYKAERLACFPRPSVRAVALDVCDVDAVIDLFADLPRPRLVVAEGLMPYLDDATSSRLLRGLARRLQPREHLLFDTLASGTPGNARVAAGLEERGIRFAAWSPAPTVQSLPGVDLVGTHLGAADAQLGLPRAARGGSLLWRCSGRASRVRRGRVE